jgi:hypothetical protein
MEPYMVVSGLPNLLGVETLAGIFGNMAENGKKEKNMAKKRLYRKYEIRKANGKPVDPNARYFVLRIDSDPSARVATLVYADEMEKIGELLFAEQLREWVAKFE